MVGTKVVVENKSESLNFWKDIDANLKEILHPTDKYTLNKVAGMVMVQASPATLDKISAYFQELNKRISQQIIVDVKVIEVTLNKDYSSGIDWAYLPIMAKSILQPILRHKILQLEILRPLPAVPQLALEPLPMAFPSCSMHLDNFGKIEVLSQPRVMLLNNTVANIQVGNSQAYVDSYTTTQTTNGTTIGGYNQFGTGGS